MKFVLQERFQDPDSRIAASEDSIFIHKRTEGQSNSRLVLFVHGLGGSRYGRRSTWQKFPSLLWQEFPGIDIGMYGYRTGLRRFFSGRTIEIPEEAKHLADQIRHRLKAWDRIVLIAHSLGGIVARGAIAGLASEVRPGSKKCRAVNGLFLMGVPQAGSLRAPRLGRWFSADARALAPHNDYLGWTNSVIQEGVKIRETGKPTGHNCVPMWAVLGAKDRWVDSYSASVGIPANQCYLSKKSHRTLAKPSDANDDVYEFVAEKISKVLYLPFRSGEEDLDGYRQYSARPAEAQDVNRIREIAARYFHMDGEESPERAGNILAKDPTSIWVVVRGGKAVGQANGVVAGFFTVLRLTAEAEGMLRSGAITGVQLEGEHIVAPGETSECSYIGSIAGEEPCARTNVMNSLGQLLAQRSGGKVMRLLSRPVTDIGLRVARANGLKPVIPKKDGVGCLFAGEFGSPDAGERIA